MAKNKVILLLVALLHFCSFSYAGSSSCIDTLSITAPYIQKIEALEQQLESERNTVNEYAKNEVLNKKVYNQLDQHSFYLVMLTVISLVSLLISIGCLVFSLKNKRNVPKLEPKQEDNLCQRLNEKLFVLEESNQQILTQLRFVLEKSSLKTQNSESANSVKIEKKIFSTAKSSKVDKQPNPVPKEERFYAMPQKEGDRTILVLSKEEEYKEYMPFVLLTSGDKGAVSFNLHSLQNSLANFETDLAPYVHSLLVSDSPHSIQTSTNGIAYLEGSTWLLKEKPTIKIV